MARCRTIIAVIGVIIIIALVITLAIVASSRGEKKEDTICETLGCRRAAARILKNMNQTIKPCDNFYEFACGGYMKSAPIPDGEISVDPFLELRTEIEQKMKAIMEEPSSPNELRSFKLAKDFYRSCMNTSNLEKVDTGPLLKNLEKLGKWPVIEGDNWKDSSFDWKESVYTCRKLGYSMDYFIAMNRRTDWKNSDKNILMLEQPSLGLPREFLIEGMDDPGVQAYYQYMVDIAVVLGADEKRAKKDLEKVVQFEIRLAEATLPEEDLLNITLINNPMTISNLSKEYSRINWEEYINHLLPPNVHFNASEVVIVSEPRFIEALEYIIATTSQRIKANYVGWRVVLESVDYLTETLRNRSSKFTSELTGIEEGGNPRWKQCLALLEENSLSISTSVLYVRNHSNEEARRAVVEMVTDLRDELTKILQKADWMDEKTRSEAVEKAKTMFSHVAYPVEFLDDKKIDELYALLELSPDDFLGNVLNLTKFKVDYNLGILKKPVNKTIWIDHEESTSVGATYTPTDNSIQIPAGVLQGVFFDKDLPRYMNYGAIGFLIGHEMTHSFDNFGREFDKDGNWLNWWTPESEKKYFEKAQCIIDQYSNYTVPSVGQNVNGEDTLGENIADNGGIKEAYLAYKEYVKRNGSESKLPGLDYTPEQMFWISNANIFCTRYRPEGAEYELRIGDHSPERFRVIGPVSNMPEFAADFKCPPNSNMNPKHKCSIL